MLIGLLHLAWYYVWKIELISRFILPSPLSVYQSLLINRAIWWSHLMQSILTLICGLIISLVCGIGLAFLFRLRERIRILLYPLVFVSQVVPIVVFAPLLLLWFGYGVMVQLTVVVLMCFYPVFHSISTQLHQIPRVYEHVIKSMGASVWQRIHFVWIPSTLLGVFGGMRVAVSYAFVSTIIAEWIASSKGIGVLLIQSQRTFNLELLYALVVLIVSVSLGLYLLLLGVERLVIPWHFLEKKSQN